MSTITAPRQHKYIGDLHFDNMEWLNALQFYKEEIGIFERRLEEIVRRNNKHDVMAELEHFQNQFIREREVIDELRHDVKTSENLLEKEVKDHPVAIDRRYFIDHSDLRDRYQTFEKLYGELTAEFRTWLAKRL
jgi:CBS-domain-containing membrane protein